MTTDSNTDAAEKPMSIRECLDAVHKAGGDAWDKVADPEGFIRWMRGSDDPKDVAAADQAMQSMPAQSPASAPEQAQPRTQAEACQQPWVLTPEGARNMEEMTQAAPEQASVAAGAYTARIKHALEFYAGEKFGGLARDALEALAALSPRPSDVREQQVEQIAKLQRFKDWVHAYLDAQGVPHHPPGTHGAEGCRIGDRMDWLMDRLRKAEAQQAEQFEKGNCVPVQPHLFWWTCRMCGTATAGEGPPTSHVCSNPNGKPYQQAEQGDGGAEAFIRERYSTNLDSMICPGNGLAPSREATRDAFFDGLRVGWKAALTQPPRQSEDGRMLEAHHFDDRLSLTALLESAGLVASRSEGERKIKEGAVKISVGNKSLRIASAAKGEEGGR